VWPYADLAGKCRQVGVGPRKQIVLVLDWASWKPRSAHLRVPDYVPDYAHLLSLSAYSPELQPAEHLWALTNTALANRHFASIDALD